MYKLSTSEITGLTKRFSTPFYVFDQRELTNRIDFIRSCIPERVQLCYAMKANPFLTKILEHTVECLEVCSPGEFFICREQGIDPSKIVVSGVYKDPHFIQGLIGQQVPVRAYTVESESQFELLLASAKSAQCNIPLLFRLTNGSQFGVDAAVIKGIIRAYKDSPYLHIRGLQFFSGTQKKSLKKVKREFAQLDALIAELKEELSFHVDELEYGTGSPVDYFNPDEEEVDLEDAMYFEGIRNLLSEMSYDGPLVFEMGRAVAASCGTYVTKIVDAKTNAGQNYAIVDGGMNHLVYFGNSLALHQPVCTAIPERDESTDECWAICGALCSMNDILCKQLPLADGKIGDILAFHRAGAYCMTEGISLFLSRDLPGVIWLDSDGKATLLRGQVPTYKLNMEQ